MAEEALAAPRIEADSTFALCLSGGGLRATLFHLGLIKALRAHRIGEGSAGRNALEVWISN